MSESESIACPFCGEDDFDKIGLKLHLQLWCPPYDATPLPKSMMHEPPPVASPLSQPPNDSPST